MKKIRLSIDDIQEQNWKSQIIGVGSENYETYENLEYLDEKFRKISDKVLKLKPKI